MTRAITVTSGKGGVGKTNLSVNISLHLASLGYRTCLFDADLGLANINILLGLYPEYTIEDVILDKKTLSDIIIRDYNGVDIIPGSSGVEKIADIDPPMTERLIKSFSILSEYDFLIFDTSAGIAKNVISFCLASPEIILLITPEPTSLTDAYALLKVLSLNNLESSVKIVVNQCKNTDIAKQTYLKFKEVTKKYLSINVQPLGVILEDSRLHEAVRAQQPFIFLFPDTIASRCVKSIARNILRNKIEVSEAYSIESFWKRCINIFKGQINLKQREEPTAHIQPGIKETVSEELPPEKKKMIETEKPVISTIVDQTVNEKGVKDTPYPDEHGLNTLICRLVEGMSSISCELKDLRKALSNNNKITFSGRSKNNDAVSINFDNKPIILDFEKYFTEHNRE